ncbi:FixH family protein [Bacillus massilinigeriensis]|uniref:FixH family protein n=1 Tax=Bacillus massilionigeriensis TaxID=1805475 RepID=UPI00096B24C2|nr:FixH family protein [Bacillus massilionigeriensis]
MKRLDIPMILLLAILAGCGTDKDWKVEVTKDLYYQKDKETSFQIKVTDDNKMVKDLKVNAEFSMANMDHGSESIPLQEEKNGLYSGNIALPMNGDYEIVLSLEKDGEKVEKVIKETVKEPKGVATIEGDWVTEQDLEFYSFINKLHIAIGRETDEQNYKGDALKEAMNYWDSQEKLNENKNQLLTQIIRLRSVALLAEEKGDKASTKEVTAELEKARLQYNKSKVAQKMIKEFGEKKFWDKEKSQYKLIVLSQKVQSDIINDVKKENPKVNEQEIYYLAQKKYEELLVSQVNSLEIELYNS